MIQTRPLTKLTVSTPILRTSASDKGIILDTSAFLCNMQCVNATRGPTLLIKPLKPDLHLIVAGAPSVRTAETIFQKSPLLVKKSSRIFFTSMSFAVVISCLQKRNSSLISYPLT